MLDKKLNNKNFYKIAWVNLKQGKDNLTCRGRKGMRAMVIG